MRSLRSAHIIAITALALLASVSALTAAQNDLPWWDRAPHGNSRHYWIKSDLPADEARELANHLDRVYEAFHQRLGSLPQRVPEQLNVFIFRDRDEYLATLGSRFNINAMGTAGVFFMSGGDSALAFWTDGVPRQRVLHVLQHEGFHQFAYSRFGRDLPPWANEGLAEFFGEAVLVGRTLVIGQSKERVIDAVRQTVERNEHVLFRDMLTMSQARWNGAVREGRAMLQYQQAWSMVHFLIYANDERYRPAFERYLRLLANAIPSEEAFIRAFETDDIEAFEQRWKEYVLEAKPSAFITALERAEFLAEGLQELSRRSVHPKSLDELKVELRGIEFSFTIQSHGMTTVLEAADDEMFEIPMDEHAREQPVFLVEPPQRRRMSLREQRLEEENPTPATLSTQHLRPHRIAIQWKRDTKTKTFSYDLTVR